MPICEEHMGVQVIPVKTIGPISVYRRLGYREIGVAKYVIFRGDMYIDECRTKAEALSFARKEAVKEEN